MEHCNQKICRLELICLMEINMISNNDMVIATSINHRVCGKYLSHNVLHNRYFIERMPLAFLFRWGYRKGDFRDMAFEANLYNGREI